jgi:hypothetical protein
MDWPTKRDFANGWPHITPLGIESIGAGTGNLGTPAAATWRNANLAIYVPFRINTTIVLSYGFVYNGAAVAGGFDIGVYAENGSKICSTGSTTQTTVSSVTSAPLLLATASSPIIGPGNYYMAISASNSTAQYYRMALGIQPSKTTGMATQVVFPLPATATFATISTAYVPCFGISSRSFI